MTQNQTESPVSCDNEALVTWVESIASLTKPDNIHWCDGSREEYDQLCSQMVELGTLIPLNPAKRPGSFLAREAHGINPGCNRVRMALVASKAQCVEAAHRIAAFLKQRA